MVGREKPRRQVTIPTVADDDANGGILNFRREAESSCDSAAGAHAAENALNASKRPGHLVRLGLANIHLLINPRIRVYGWDVLLRPLPNAGYRSFALLWLQPYHLNSLPMLFLEVLAAANGSARRSHCAHQVSDGVVSLVY